MLLTAVIYMHSWVASYYMWKTEDGGGEKKKARKKIETVVVSLAQKKNPKQNQGIRANGKARKASRSPD